MDTKMQWKIELTDGRIFKGTAPFADGRVRIVRELPAGTLRRVTARIPLAIPEDGRIFMNGYQTWSSSPERTKKGRIRGLHGLPKQAIEHFSLDRYADYHFMPYPNRKGVLHGYSYCYFKTDGYLLIGSADERPGYTIFRYEAAKDMLYVIRDCEGVRCEGEFTAFDLYVGEGTEDEVFDGWFAAMGITPRTKEKIAGYSSWYNRYQNITQQLIMEDLAGTEGILREGDLFQIDDGWEPFVGDWLAADAEKFPEGMKAAADAIHEKGYRAGLWLAPFVAEEKSAVCKEHPDWFLKDPVNGGPWKAGCNWSGFYALDIDKPEVISYLKEVFRRVFDEWGYDLVKLDFLYAAAPYGNENESRAGRMFRAAEFLRERCGDRLILGCGVPLAPVFGLFDYCRIGCDVTLDWNDRLYMRIVHSERPSTKNAITNAIYRYPLDGRAFGNDPDVFFLRTENLRLPYARKNQLAGTCALYGSVFLTSDDMGKYGEEQKEEYRKLRELFEKR